MTKLRIGKGETERPFPTRRRFLLSIIVCVFIRKVADSLQNIWRRKGHTNCRVTFHALACATY